MEIEALVMEQVEEGTDERGFVVFGGVAEAESLLHVLSGIPCEKERVDGRKPRS